MVNEEVRYSETGLQVVVLKKFKSKIYFKKLFKDDHYFILLINVGSISIKINNRKINLRKDELIVITKNTLCEVLLISRHLQICHLSFTSDFVYENSTKWPHIQNFDFLITQISSKISLDTEDIITVISLFKLVNNKLVSDPFLVYKKEILSLSFNLLLYELACIYHRLSWNLSVKYSRKETLVIQFFKILEMNFKKHHNVKFYADDLHVTTGHLTKIVKKVTSKTAKEVITQSIVLEAKILLQDNQLTIFCIIEELQFPSPSSFCTFFKRHTSLTPSEYRAQLNIN